MGDLPGESDAARYVGLDSLQVERHQLLVMSVCHRVIRPHLLYRVDLSPVRMGNFVDDDVIERSVVAAPLLEPHDVPAVFGCLGERDHTGHTWHRHLESGNLTLKKY